MKKKRLNSIRGSGWRKIFLIMRITVLLFFVGLMNLSASVYSQQAKLQVTVENKSILEVLKMIEDQSDFHFLYRSDNLQGISVGRIDLKDAKLEDILDKVLVPKGFTYEIEDRTVVIKKALPVKNQDQQQPQKKEIRGIVTDSKGLPLPGATVMAKGTTLGTSSDNDGKFTLIVPGDTKILTFSFLGMMSQEISLANQTTVSVVMKETLVDVGEVVVTALGIKKDYRSLSYDVQQLDAKALTTVDDGSIVDALAGKVAGVTINTSSTGVGGSARVVMRGTKSIAGNNNALFVVDGIPLPSLQSVQPADIFQGAGQTGDGIANFNPEDIESVSVLSGPAAAALYGTQAANGVIMITTKKGEKGLSVNVSNSTTFNSPFVLPRFQNTYGITATGSYYSWGDKLASPSTYNPKDFFQTGFNVNNSVSISTGTEKNTTYLSLGSVSAQGIIQNNNLDRYNFSFRNSAKLNDKVTLDLSAMFMKVQEQNMLAQGQYFNPLIPVYLFPPGDDIRKYQLFERYDATRNFKTQYWPFGDLGFQMQNPYWIANKDNFINNKNRFLMSGALKFDIAPWINITARAKIDNNTMVNDKDFNASTAGLFAGPAGAFYRYNIGDQQIYADAIVNIDKNFKDYSITANIGSSVQDFQDSNASIGGNLQSVPNLFTYANLNKSALQQLTKQDYHDQTQAIFATAQFGYKHMAFIDLTSRNDWVSALANTSTKSIFYPSVGLSGVLTDIFKVKSNVLSFVKGRLSYSEVGNAPQRFLSNLTYPVFDGFPQLTPYLPATGLQPERTKSYEAGLNAMFFGSKVKLDVTVYQSSTYNQLFNPTLPASTGFSSWYINSGRIDNKGIEASLSVNQKLGKVNWNSTVVYSLNRNTIKSLVNGYTNPLTGGKISIDSLDMGGTASYKMMLVTGGSMGDIYVNALKQDEYGNIFVNSASQAVLPDQNRFVKAGNASPKYTLGFRNSFSFKGFNLGVLINARVGGVGVSVTQAVMDAFGVSQASAQARDNGGALVNGYKIPPQPYYQTIGGGTSGIGAMYVYNMTNVRLAELSLGYDIPVNKCIPWIQGFNLSLIGRNLFMFYNKAPFDPESTANTGTYYQGIDYFMQPSLKSLGFSVKFRF